MTLFRIFIYGSNPSNKRKIQNLNNLFKNRNRKKFRLEVVDLQKHPEKAEEENVLAVPMLEKKSPPPRVRFIGDFDKEDELISVFGLE